MSGPLLYALSVLASYLLGAIPFGLLIGRAWKGVDIRQHGSGNLGATNALRVLGPKVGGLVLALDALKGALPVLLLPLAVEALGGGAPASGLPVVLAAAAIVGHVFPVYLGFKGGKGVATSAGAFLALHPPAFGVAFAVFVLALAATRTVSLSSILAALALPAAAILLDGPRAAFAPHLAPRTGLLLAIALLVIVRHRSNLARILRGEEPRLGAQRAADPAARPPEAAAEEDARGSTTDP